MPGFDVLSPDIDLFKSHFLDASAGTGKTFAIEHIALRLLIEKEGLTLDRILIVTFTKAATLELKRRLRKTLEKALISLPEFSFLSGKTAEELFLIKKKIYRALSLFDEAKIMTIHSFCHSCLSQDFQEFVSEEIDESLSLNMVKDFLRSQCPLAPFQMDRLLRFYQMDLDCLIKDLLKIALKRMPIECIDNFENQKKAFLSHLGFLKENYSSEKVLEDLLEHAHCFKGMLDRSKKIKEEVYEEIVCFSQWSEELSKYRLLGEMIEENALRRKPDIKIHYPELLNHLQRTIFPLISEMRNHNFLFATLSESVRRHLMKEKKALFHDDLLIEMAKRVENPHFQETVKKAFDAILIDEFQDTDHLQWKIFSKLFLNTEKPLYLIGDPKQSIYRFRGADIYTYFQAKNTFSPDAHFTLSKNYRSSSSLVFALNDLFAIRKPFLTLPKTGEKIDCPPMESDETTGCAFKSDGKGSIHIWHGKEEEDFFPFIVEEIKYLSNEWKIPLSECAVLVKDRHQAERFQKYARSKNIYAVSKRHRPLTLSPAYGALMEFIAGFDSLQQRGVIEKILGGPIFSYSEEEIISKKEEAAILFFGLKEILKNQGIIPWFLALKNNGLFEQMLSREEGLFLCADLSQLVEILAENVQEYSGYVPFLKHLESLPEDVEWLQGYTLGLDEMVPILTVHGSKGLEFEVVFSLGTSLSSQTRKELFFDREKGAYCFSESLFADEQREGEGEKIRLFYVAATRAKKRLYLPYLVEESQSPFNLFLGPHAIPKSPHITESHCLKKHSITPSESAEERHLVCPKKLYFTFPVTQVHSFSSLSKKIGNDHSEKWDERVVTENLPAGKETGNIIHKLFQNLPWERACLASLCSLKEMIAPMLVHSGFEPYMDEISAMIYEALSMKLPIFCSLREIPAQNVIREAPFLYSYQEGYMKGFIDLIFLHRNKFYIVDWKTNVLDEYSQESLQRAMELHNYHLQSQIYREAASKFAQQLKLPFGGSFFIFLRALDKQEVSPYVYDAER